MAAINVYNQKGEIIEQMELPEFLTAQWKPDLVHQVVKSIMANRRKPVAHTKTRAEVSGGGKKPWRQKGTGRSRHGSIRSPLWKGGGTTFGPRSEKIYTEKINKKMLRAALISVLSKKVLDGEIKIFDTLELASNKTKPLAVLLQKIINNKSAVLLFPENNKNIRLASRNL
ncbi:MAG: large subunit ribosomal protein L4, partial [Parcubacteria group bacterium Athens0714_26]